MVEFSRGLKEDPQSQVDRLHSSAADFINKRESNSDVSSWAIDKFDALIVVAFGNDTEKILQRATFIQGLAGDFFQYLCGESDELAGRQLRSFVGLMRNVPKFVESNEAGIGLRSVFNSAKVQAGAMYCLKEAGFTVVFPTSEDEVKEIDLRGVDFAAISPEGKYYFIDTKSADRGRPVGIASKGKSFSEVGGMFNSINSLVSKNKLPVINRSVNGKITLEYAFLNVYLPPNLEYMNPYGMVIRSSRHWLIREINEVKTESWI